MLSPVKVWEIQGLVSSLLKQALDWHVHRHCCWYHWYLRALGQDVSASGFLQHTENRPVMLWDHSRLLKEVLLGYQS